MGSSDDQAAVEGAVRDYFEGWFTASTDRMGRALHPDLVKRGAPSATAATFPSTSKERMMELTSQGEGTSDVGDGRLEIRIDDLYHHIANVTVRGGVYREYLQLIRTDEGWKIANTLWAIESEDETASDA
jgi:hypothetical protein